MPLNSPVCKYRLCLTRFVFFCFLFFNLFIFGCIGSLLLCAGFLSLRRAGSTLRCGEWACHCGGFSCCGARALGMRASVVVARGLSSCGSRALKHRLSSCGAQAYASWHVGSSRTRDRTCVPCIGRRILNHCATGEVPVLLIIYRPPLPTCL